MNDNLSPFFKEIVRDLMSAEKLIIERGLSPMIGAATNDELKVLLVEHLDETTAQLEMLEEVAGKLGVASNGKVCKGMEGIITEGEELLALGLTGVDLDFAIVAAAQKIEHYEIASYSFAVMLAEVVGEDDAVEVFDEILDQEISDSQKLDEILDLLAEGAEGDEFDELDDSIDE